MSSASSRISGEARHVGGLLLLAASGEEEEEGPPPGTNTSAPARGGRRGVLAVGAAEGAGRLAAERLRATGHALHTPLLLLPSPPPSRPSPSASSPSSLSPPACTAAPAAAIRPCPSHPRAAIRCCSASAISRASSSPAASRRDAQCRRAREGGGGEGRGALQAASQPRSTLNTQTQATQDPGAILTFLVVEAKEVQHAVHQQHARLAQQRVAPLGRLPAGGVE
jgi:hypothetical protein